MQPPTQPQHVADWPFVKTTVAEFKAAIPRMRPVAPSKFTRGEVTPPQVGVSLWSTSIDGREVGIEWEWESRDGVSLVVANPMAVDTNVLLFESDRLLDNVECMLFLGRAVYELPWVEHLLHRH